jgi:hypothetical protein
MYKGREFCAEPIENNYRKETQKQRREKNEGKRRQFE